MFTNKISNSKVNEMLIFIKNELSIFESVKIDSIKNNHYIISIFYMFLVRVITCILESYSILTKEELIENQTLNYLYTRMSNELHTNDCLAKYSFISACTVIQNFYNKLINDVPDSNSSMYSYEQINLHYKNILSFIDTFIKSFYDDFDCYKAITSVDITCC